MGNKIGASMQKKASEFMETNKKRWHDLNFRHPGIEGLVVYGSIFLVFIIVLYAIFAKANIFQCTEANSARYMLSALIQSQAAIVAIVLIVTQIAIQLFLSHLNGLFLLRSGFGYSVMLLLFHMQAAKSLGAVGKAAVENRLEDAKKRAASALAALTIISKEIVETTISDYESKLRESDRSLYIKIKIL